MGPRVEDRKSRIARGQPIYDPRKQKWRGDRSAGRLSVHAGVEGQFHQWQHQLQSERQFGVPHVYHY